MLMVDAQQNIAFNAQQLERDFTRWAWHQRQADLRPELPPATTSLLDNLLGRVAIVFGSLQVIAESSPALRTWQRYTYRTTGDAQELARWQLDHYRRLADDHKRIELILNITDLDNILDSWRQDKSLDQRLHGIVILMKGAEAIAEPRQSEQWLEDGVRIVAPAWQPNRYIAGYDGELTLLGYELLDVMANFNVLLDISGLSDRPAAEAIERYEASIIASHANPRYFHDSPRCLSDDLILRLAERDGVIGIMVYNRYLRQDWHPSDPKRRVTISHWVDAVDYVCQLTGAVDHVGLGSNIDGGYAYSSLPDEIDTSSDLWLLRNALLKRGFTEPEVNGILGGNMLRKLRESLPDG
ncbi:MAG: membrane dipeptidase [Chloroflexi bacterium]|nr:membrane dipeptidase [Chloroflexota bacterium]